MSRSSLVSIVVFLTVLMLFQFTPVSAHNPTSVDLSYDFESQELTVDVAHSTTDINSHYIYQVEVQKNSVVVLTREYTTQNTTSGMSATYHVAAIHGDVLSVTARCTLAGIRTSQITVVDPDNTETTPTNNGEPQMAMPILIAVAIVAIGAVAVVFAFMRRR